MNIAKKIEESRKYKPLYKGTIERIVDNAVTKYGEKNAEKEARNMLHQIWDAYYGIRPNLKKALTRLKGDLKEGKNEKEAIKKILALHSSTNERLEVLDRFYKDIFEITGVPNSIIDCACGLNPLTVFWMNLPKETIYQAFDIDEEEVSFLKKAFTVLKPIPVPKVQVGDVINKNEFPKADVTFFLKTYPVLEIQEKGAGLAAIEKQKCKYVIVSFPTKSIGGKEKGMTDFYTKQFEAVAQSKKWEYKKLQFPTELVFVILWSG